MIKVSIIIPVYNVEPYIRECLNSVINQTLKEIEIICIDDCSQDNSIRIIEQYSKKDSRIKLIYNKENLGQGESRNKGIIEAKGEYIYFIDSDDFIDLNYIENMYNCIHSNKAYIVINKNVIKFHNKKPLFNKYVFKKNTTENVQITNCNMYEFPVMPWCKIYKKSFLINNNLFFPKKLKYEDNYFDALTLSYVDNVFVIYNGTYYYKQRNNSTTSSIDGKISRFDICGVVSEIYTEYKNRNLINTKKINFVYMFNYHLNNHREPEILFKKIKDFFEISKNDLINNSIYEIYEKEYIKNILISKSYEEFIKLEKMKNEKEIKLFNLFPLLKRNFCNGKVYYKLFNFIPLLKQKNKGNSTVYYLFNFLLIFKNKRK